MSESVYFGDARAGQPDEGVGRRLAKRSGAGEMLLRRWGGCWIDLIVLGLIIFVPTLLTGGKGAGIVIGFLAALVYFPVMETKWGRTVGKMATGTIIVDREGRIPNVWQVLIRTAFRLFEVNPFLLGAIPAGIAVLTTAAHQRIGDLAAGTYVVMLEDLRRVASQRPNVEASIFD